MNEVHFFRIRIKVANLGKQLVFIFLLLNILANKKNNVVINEQNFVCVVLLFE